MAKSRPMKSADVPAYNSPSNSERSHVVAPDFYEKNKHGDHKVRKSQGKAKRISNTGTLFVLGEHRR